MQEIAHLLKFDHPIIVLVNAPQEGDNLRIVRQEPGIEQILLHIDEIEPPIIHFGEVDFTHNLLRAESRVEQIGLMNL